MNGKIWFHADDCGVTAQQAQKILACHREGVLNSISILPNTPSLGEALEILDKEDPKAEIRRVLHLNFVEGKPLVGADKVPLLVDKEGFFNKSFIRLFLWNITKISTNRNRLKQQIKLEIAAQLRAVTSQYNYRITAIDSHQHYHMIPIVLDSLLEVLSEQEFEHLRIRQIRIPCDPVSPLVHTQGMPKRVPVMNLVKWCILKIYAGRSQVLLKSRGIQSPVFFGIFFTREMKWEVVKTLLPAYQSYAGRKASELELMFHPGNLTAAYELLDARNKELADFYMSDNRFYEAECLKLLGVNSKDT